MSNRMGAGGQMSAGGAAREYALSSGPRLADLAISARNVDRSRSAVVQMLESSGLAVHEISGAFRGFQSTIAAGEGPRLALVLEYGVDSEFSAYRSSAESAAAITGAFAALSLVGNLPPGLVRLFGVPVGNPASRDSHALSAMIDGGVFEPFDAAIMMQAGSADLASASSTPAAQAISLTFIGKASHAAASPERGINAVEAALQTFALVNSLRQHLRSETRFEGVLPRGGSAANIVPDEATADFWIRAPGPLSISRATKRLIRAAQASAAAAGATVRHAEITPVYKNVIPSPPLRDIAAVNLKRSGRKSKAAALTYSTGFGNISHLIPSILMTFKETAPAIAPFADDLGFAAAWLAVTIVDILAAPEAIHAAKEQLHARVTQMEHFQRRAEAEGDG